MAAVDGTFIQAESEVSAINMVYGAAAAGGLAMTSSSSPGISLKMEGISYIAAAELPCVIVNIMRGGPGLGGIQPAQSDYFQATKGGGHGDYRLIVLAPASVQEMYELTRQAFKLSQEYRNPVMILGDGFLGQMIEVVDSSNYSNDENVCEGSQYNQWFTCGCKGRSKNHINTLYLEPEVLEQLNNNLQKKYQIITDNETREECYMIDDAEVAVVSFGIASRIAKEAIDMARSIGIKAGLIRPITLWPFPQTTLKKKADSLKAILSVEMNAGQMVEDVKLAVESAVPVYHYGRTGGIIPTASEVMMYIKKIGE